MLNTLSDSFNTFFSSGRKMVSSLIKDMKLNKTDIQNLSSKLIAGQRFGDFAGVNVSKYALIEREPIVELFRDSSIRTKTLFNAVNASGLVLDSIVGIVSSEIDKVEKDLNDLQTFIDNYEFIAGKDDLYNVNYIEKFDNLLNTYKFDGYSFNVPDRDRSPFPSDGNVFVDSSIGVMKIGKNQSTKNVIKNIKSINVYNNYQNYITTDSNFLNVFNDNLIDSWSITVKSPTILNSGLNDFKKYISYNDEFVYGATTAVEMVFNSPVTMDTIRITPNLGSDLLLKQIIIFDANNVNRTSQDTSNGYIALMDSHKIINNQVEVNFNATTASKIIMIFNQLAYTRSKKAPIISEINSKSMQEFINKRLDDRRLRFSIFQDIAYWYFKRKFLINGIKSNKSSDIEYYSNRFPYEISSYMKQVENEMFRASNLDLSDRQIFTSSPIFIDLIKNMMNYMGIDSEFMTFDYFVETNSNVRKNSILNYPGFISQKNSDMINDPKLQFFKDSTGSGNISKAISKLVLGESEDLYEYNFSIKSIEFIKTNSQNANKACFVSKKIPVDGQVLGAKAKIQTLDSVLVSENRNFDLKLGISYELSISNVDYPVNELDWYPLAFNDSDLIDSEVVFFDVSNFTYKPRFIPKSDSIILFKDGYLVLPSKYRYITNSNTLELLDSSVYSPTSIFCVKYYINDSLYDPYQIDFIKSNIYKESVKQFSSRDGLGQLFNRTSSDGTITLEYMPYVNETLRTAARYDQFYGTIFTDNATGYSPVKVQLSDGSFALNLTNYSKSAQLVSFFSSTSTQFIQNGKNIVFNKSINTPFRVFYEYVPNSVRFRLIMRKNIPNIDISGKADSVLIKMKTSYFDPYYDKLNYISRN